MAILMKFATCHIRNTFKRPLRPNAPTVRVLTSVILKGIGWAFRKLYPSKIPGMVHQGLLAPQRLYFKASSHFHTRKSFRFMLVPGGLQFLITSTWFAWRPVTSISKSHVLTARARVNLFDVVFCTRSGNLMVKVNGV